MTGWVTNSKPVGVYDVMPELKEINPLFAIQKCWRSTPNSLNGVGKLKGLWRSSTTLTNPGLWDCKHGQAKPSAPGVHICES